MAYFRITNNTLNLGKRHPRFNTAQSIEYKDLLGVHKNTIHPGTEIIIESEFLPVSAHKLRAEGFITVQEIDKNSYQKLVLAKEEFAKVEPIVTSTVSTDDPQVTLTTDDSKKIRRK